MATSPLAAAPMRTQDRLQHLFARLFWPDDQTGLFAGSAIRKLPYAVVAGPLFVAHLALSQLGWVLISGGPLTPVWPAAGLDLVALLVFGTRFWPVLFAAYFVTTSGRAVAWAPALGMSMSNVLRSLAGVWLFTAISNKKKFLGQFEELGAIAAASLLSPVVGAGVGTGILIL